LDKHIHKTQLSLKDVIPSFVHVKEPKLFLHTRVKKTQLIRQANT